MYIWSLSLPFWPLSLPFCSPPAVWQACREHPKIATPYKSDTYKISVFSTCIRNDRWRTPPAKKAAKPRRQKAAKPRRQRAPKPRRQRAPKPRRQKAPKPRRQKAPKPRRQKAPRGKVPKPATQKDHKTPDKKRTGH